MFPQDDNPLLLADAVALPPALLKQLNAMEVDPDLQWFHKQKELKAQAREEKAKKALERALVQIETQLHVRGPNAKLNYKIRQGKGCRKSCCKSSSKGGKGSCFWEAQREPTKGRKHRRGRRIDCSYLIRTCMKFQYQAPAKKSKKSEPDDETAAEENKAG